MKKIENVTRREVLDWLLEYLKPKSDKQHFNAYVSEYKPLKTFNQLKFLFGAIRAFLKERDKTEYTNDDEVEYMYLGLVDRYSFKKPSGLKTEDEDGNVVDQLVAIPLSKVNRFEQFEAILNGLCFVEAPEQGVDMSEYFRRWEKIKEQEKEYATGKKK